MSFLPVESQSTVIDPERGVTFQCLMINRDAIRTYKVFETATDYGFNIYGDDEVTANEVTMNVVCPDRPEYCIGTLNFRRNEFSDLLDDALAQYSKIYKREGGAFKDRRVNILVRFIDEQIFSDSYE